MNKTTKFMQTKRSIKDFNMSEPSLIGVMDRHGYWCRLIGGGQEINTGEAGLGRWLALVGFLLDIISDVPIRNSTS